MADKLTEIHNLLTAKLNAILTAAGCERVQNFEIIPDPSDLSLKYGFPAIGLLDDGDSETAGCSTGQSTERVNIALYVKLYDRSKSTLLIRKMKEIIRAEMLNEFSGCTYKRSSKIVKFAERKKSGKASEYILFKLMMFEFFSEVINV